MDGISQFIVNLFQDNVVMATIIISMIPLIELKGAIPFAMSKNFWGAKALGPWQALGCSFLGGIVVTAILALIFKPIYNAVKDKRGFKAFINFFTSSASKKSSEINENTTTQDSRKKTLIKLFAVLAFVAIPVPGTGVYTGTVLAVFLGLNYWQTLLTVTVGNFFAGLIIKFVCELFPEFTSIIFYIFIAFILAFLVYRLVVHYVQKHKEKNESGKQ